MRGGSGKRFLRELTARWEASQLGKAEAQVRALEILIKKTINDTEEFLETKGKKITGSTREELMLSITVLLDSLRHDEEELANALGEIDSLLEEIARLEKNSEIKDRLIALFEKLVAEKDSVGAGLQQEIQELRQQLAEQAEEISRIRNRKKNGQAREKTLEEQRQDYQRRLEKIRKRQDELEKMLEEIDSGEDESQDLDGEACEEGTEPPEMEETGAEEQEGTKTEEVQNPGNAEMDSVDSEAGSTDPEESQTNPETSPDGADKAEGGTDSDTPESDECPEGSESGENREEELLDEIKKLKEELDEWKYRAQRNSSTSSIPPRMDGYNKGKPARPEGQEDDVTVCGQDEGEGDEEFWKEEEEAEKAALHDPDKSPNKKPLVGRRGKPPGSLGGGRTRPEYDETRLVKCVPSQCMSCPHRENCGALENARPVGRAFSVFDIKITRVITNYQPMECKCPNQEGQTLTGVYPKDVNNWFQFGNGIRALAVCLNTVGMVSYERISDILQSLIGDDKISGRVVNNWVSQTADRLTPLMKYLRAGVFDGPYMNNDETGIHVKGRLHWVHTACNMLFTYMRVDKQRGNGAQERIGVIPDYIGTMITDCWSSYWGKGKAHGLCIAHLLRELYALIKHFKKDREWAQEMMDLLMEMKEAREGLISEGKTQFEPSEYEGFVARYRKIVEKGLAQHPDSEIRKKNRGPGKKSRGRNLLERLKEREENFLLFLKDFNVPFTNNLAEKSFRLFSCKRGIVGSFDTYEGADDFAAIWSFISTAGKRKLNSFDAIKAAIEGTAVDFLFDSEEKEYLEEVIKDLDQKNLERFLGFKEDCREEMERKRTEAENYTRKAAEVQAKAKQEKDKVEEARAIAKEAEQKLLVEEQRGGKNVEKLRRQLDKAIGCVAKGLEKASKLFEKADGLVQKAKDAKEKYEKATEELGYLLKIAIHLLDIPKEYWPEESEA